MSNLFKAYDIRGKYPEPLSAKFARALGLAIVEVFRPQSCVIGRDARLSGPVLQNSLAKALRERDIDLAYLGECGTEEIYHAAANGDFDLGIMITGSHNPADENGFKLVRRGAIPIGHDSGLQILEAKTAQIFADLAASSPEICASESARGKPGNHCAIQECDKNNSKHHLAGADSAALQKQSRPGAAPGGSQNTSEKFRQKYLDWLVSYSGIKTANRRKLRIVADAGNGCAGLLLEPLSKIIPHELIALNCQPDGNFPHGVPNPLLQEKRVLTSRAVLANQADLGIAFDGDFDRCFFFDASGNFIESYYLVGLLASVLLKNHPGEKIVHDTRVYWNTAEMVQNAGGLPIMGKTGHAWMKEKMRAENALYGGEMSAHHYFRDFAYCDSGMLTMLLVLAFLQNTDKSLADILEDRMQAFPCSGEINFKTPDALATMLMLAEKFRHLACKTDNVDGINMEMRDWRFNLRSSNTEPLLRLNLETRGDRDLLAQKQAEITKLILDNGAIIYMEGGKNP